MDEQRYQELFRDVDRWVLKARQHLFVAEVLTAPMREVLVDFLGDRVGAARQAPEFLEKAVRISALSNARALYFGLALENAAKARQILLGHVTVQSGNPKRLRTDHNVLEHVRQCGVSLNDEETEFLRLIAYQTTTLAKYPIAKNLDAQNEFTGRAVGAIPEEATRVRAMLLRILDDERLISVFEHGRCSKYFLE